jgi:hypothetical protein
VRELDERVGLWEHSEGPTLLGGGREGWIPTPGTEVIYRLSRAWLVFFILLAVPLNGYAQSYKVERGQDQIKVESCALSGTNFRLVRGETTLKGKLAAAIKLLTDSAA